MSPTLPLGIGTLPNADLQVDKPSQPLKFGHVQVLRQHVSWTPSPQILYNRTNLFHNLLEP